MQSSSEKIDDDSKKFLQDVKKGKPRKFVIVKEGVQIDRLFVFKKGPFDRFVRKAKKEGVRGEAFWGVIRGDGVDIKFELSRADGFENPPGKDIRLKEFLKEETEFKFEPSYVIVDALTPVDEADGDANEAADTGTAVAEADAGAGNAVVQDDTVAASAVVDEDAGAKFIDLLKKLLPHVKRALAKPTSVSQELQTRVREAQDFGRQREFQQGLATLRIVGQLTKQALAEGESAAPVGDEERNFNERLAKVGAMAGHPELGETSVGDEIQRRLEDAESTSRNKQFDRANHCLAQVERLLDLARAEAKRRREWQQRYSELEPRSADLIQASAPNANQIRAIIDYSTGEAQRKQYVKALVGLDRLEKFMAAP